MEVLGDGLTVTEAAGRFGVSRQAVHGWLRRYRTGGLEALANRSHRPDSCPHQMPAAVETRRRESRSGSRSRIAGGPARLGRPAGAGHVHAVVASLAATSIFLARVGATLARIVLVGLAAMTLSLLAGRLLHP